MRYLPILFVILLSTASMSALINDINIHLTPNGQRTKVQYEINYMINQTTVSLITFYNIFDLYVSSNGKKLNCKVNKKQLITSIVCKNVNVKNVNVTFFTNDLIKDKNGIKYINFEIPITNPINMTYVRIELPQGFVVVDKEKFSNTGIDPFYPTNGKTETTGRTISIVWKIKKPELGKNLRFYVYYEQASKFNSLIWLIIPMSILLLILIFVFKIKNDTKLILSALSDDEKSILEIILKKKKLYQKDIVVETGFSKAKVSRILKDFEKRGLIKRERYGRKSKIKLMKLRW